MKSISRGTNRSNPQDEEENGSGVTESQVDEFLRKVLEVQRRYFYETDKRTRSDRRAELMKHARIILGADKGGAK